MKRLIIFILAVVFILGFFILKYNIESRNYEYLDTKNNLSEKNEEKNQQQNSENDEIFLGAPENLDLPFDVKDIGGGNELFTPFGLIRHERDKGHGHAGIDVPLSKGDEIYAVADGKIIINQPATDGGEGNNFEGNNVVLLIAEGEREGEGWGFLYEHINLNSEIQVGTKINEGQLIGKSALTNGNNHLGLVYYFNNFQYIKEPKCWIEYLNSEDKEKFSEAWEKIRSNDKFTESWRNSYEDGAYPYRALLNPDVFPDGPQLCYKYGLDVREFK